MFKIGDKVTSKKTGLPAIGNVNCVMASSFFFRIYKLQLEICPDLDEWRVVSLTTGVESFNLWKELYPNWPTKDIVSIKFDMPQRTCTYQEYEAAIDPNVEFFKDKYLIREMYEKDVPEQTMAIYPVEDLELLHAETTNQVG